MATPLENGKTHTGTRPCKKAKKRQLHRKLVPINESSKESKRNSKERNAEEQDSAPLACGIRVGDMENVSEALGLRSDFLNGVQSLPQDIFNHRGFRGFVNIHIQNEYFEIEEQSLKVKLSEELLRRIGFTDSSVINTIMTRSKTMGQHLDLIDFIKRFVKDEFKYHPTLMEHASEDKASIPKGTGVFHFADYSNDEQNEYCKVVRLFHGTDLHSALDIMKNGIKLDFGRHKHDFSDGGGFYLTTQFDHAKAWACCQSRKPVVLELKIPKTCLEEARTLKLDVYNKKGRSEWDRVVEEQRSGRPSKKLRQELKKYDCITGPISVAQQSDGKTIRIPEHGSYQLCVIKRSFAEKIEKNVKYTLYTEHQE